MFTSSGGPKVFEIDRVVLSVRNGYSTALVGPHSATTRLAYTVPAGRTSLVQLISIAFMRDVAPSTAGIAAARYNPVGSGYALAAREIVAAIGAGHERSATANIFLPAASVAQFETQDLSTGGSYTYDLWHNIWEMVL